MNTLEYMKSIGIKGELEITLEQRARLVKEGVRFSRGRCWDNDSDLVLVCSEVEKLERGIKEDLGTGNTWCIHDIWAWKYLEDTFHVGTDGGVHFSGLTIYYQEEGIK